MEKSIPYLWGEILAVIEQKHRFTPHEFNNAVEKPLTAFGQLAKKIVGIDSVNDQITEKISQIDGILPERLTIEQQGDVWIGYYHHKHHQKQRNNEN